MKNKSGIIAFIIILTLLCLYYLHFTPVVQSIEKEAISYATDKEGVVNTTKKQQYLDSIWNQPVYNLMGYEFTYKDIKSKEISLGLDLQGGMHVTLEVSPIEILKVLSGNSTDPAFLKALEDAKELQKGSQKKYADLFYEAYTKENPDGQLAKIFTNSSNKGKIDFNTSNNEVMKVIGKEIDDAVDRSFNILRTRIDKFGVANPNIQKMPGTGRILIELPGIDNPVRVRKLLSGVAKLEFLEVYEMQELSSNLQQFNDYLVKLEQKEKLNPNLAKDKKEETKEKNNDLAVKKEEKKDLSVKKDTAKTQKEEKKDLVVKKDTNTTAVAKNDSSALKDSVEKAIAELKQKQDSANTTQSSLFGTLFIPTQEGLAVNIKDTARANNILNSAEVRTLFPSNLKFLWAVKATKDTELLTLYTIKKPKSGKGTLEGDVIRDARQDFDDKARPEISMQMNPDGARAWKKLTAANIGKRIAIVLDDNVYSAPVVQNEIPNGNSSISGNFTIEEAADLANILKAGKLPAPTRIVEEAIVGPSLGQESITQGLISMLAGLVIVIIFMIAYYNFSGAVANIALLVNIFFIIGLLAQFGAVLTLAGMAGIVLTIGMSVDANVLIYERIKEELKSGKPLGTAIKLGYNKAYSSIIDANVTTFLIGIILFFFGSGGVKGFAVTLMIGIVSSLFCAIFVTRLIIEALAKNPNRKISFDTFISKNLFQNANYNFIGNRRLAYLFSFTIIVIGLSLIAVKGGLNFGVDFKGGRSYVVQFTEEVSVTDVRSEVNKQFEVSTEVKTFGGNNQLKITTSYLIDDESEQADEKAETLLLKGLENFKAKSPEIVSSTKVGASIADDIVKTSFYAVLISLVGIFVYILARFQKWQYGLGALVALFHDVLMVFAFFGISAALGIIYEVDQVFIAAVLTVIGYSINDTVVVFDRIREFAGDITRSEFKTSLNSAINDTLSRTIMTSATTLVVVVVLFLFGGEVLRGFSFSLLVGIAMGTYSSIFVAAPIVLDFAFKKSIDNKDKKNTAVATK